MRWAEFIGDETLREITGAEDAADDAPANPEAPVICPLDHLGLLKIAGDDAEDFLHNQASNDLRAMAENESRLAALCNPKGRMYCLFSAFCKDDAWYLQMPRERVAPIMKRLSMFVLRAKVEIEDASERLPAFGVVGADASGDDVFADAAARVPATGGGRFAVFAPEETLIRLWRDATARGYRATNHDYWRLCDVRSGIPHVCDATSEQFVPQMANVDLLGGVSFSKGCYPGQEIVARTHYLGKLKRRMYLFASEARKLDPGDAIFSEKQTEPCGRIVNFCPLPGGVSPGLAVLRIAAAGDPLHAGAPDGPPLTIAPQPYEVGEHSHNPEEKS